MTAPNHENIDYWLFDWVEGNLSPEQEEQLRVFLLIHPEYEADADAWRGTTLQSEHLVQPEEVHFSLPQQPQPFVSTTYPAFAWARRLVLASLVFLFWTPLIPTRNLGSTQQNAKIAQAPLSFSVNGTTKNLNTGTGSHHVSKMQQHPPRVTAPLVTALHTEIKTSTLMQQNPEVFSKLMLETPLRPIEKMYNPTRISMIPSGLALTELVGNSPEYLASHREKTRRNKDWSFHMPKSLEKYLKKEAVSATQKDRIYVAQEKSHLDLNQGFTGATSQTRFQSTSFVRDFQGGDAKFRQQISMDGYLRQIKSGIGVVGEYANFQQGTIKDWQLRFIYSPKIALSRYITLEPSVSYVFGQKQLNANKITNHATFAYETMTLQQFNYDANLPIGKSLFYRDLNAGILVNAGPVYLGGQVQNLLKHQDNIYTNNLNEIGRSAHQTTLIAGTDFSARKGDIRFSPQVIYEFSATYQRTQLGGSLQLKNWAIGGNYGLNKSFTAMVGYHMPQFSILYQTTKSTSIVSLQKYYLHQISLRISSKISRKSRRYLSL